MILPGDVGKQGPAGPLSGVIPHIQQPEPHHVHGDSPRAASTGHIVPDEQADVGGMADEKHGDDDGGGAGDDERPPAADPGLASVAGVANERLDEEAREGPTEPDEAGPPVRDTELLHVRRQQGQL